MVTGVSVNLKGRLILIKSGVPSYSGTDSFERRIESFKKLVVPNIIEIKKACTAGFV